MEKKVNPFFQRLAMLTGMEVMEKLAQANVLLVGLGGVGSWCAEALARSGIGNIYLVDFDIVCPSNINRQLPATSKTLNRAKVEILKERLLEINPQCNVTAFEKKFSHENAGEFNIEQMDYVIDAIDTFPHKLDLIEASCSAGAKLFSSMGMARKMDPGRLKTTGIWETRGCPLAQLVRSGLRKRGFNGAFTVVYSDERLKQHIDCKRINGTCVTVTATAGMVLASLVLRDIAGVN